MLELSTSNNFKVSLIKKNRAWWILHFSILPEFTYTWQLTSLARDTNRLLPQILLAECDNPQGLPFKSEMLETETAHFYEHVLLEYLCNQRLKKGVSEVSCEGRTFWNIADTPSTHFTIAVDRQAESVTQFSQAVHLSNRLLNGIIENSCTPKGECIPYRLVA